MTCCRKLCTSTVRQHLASHGVGHGALAVGILLGWSSLAIPQLTQESDNSLGKISLTQASWIANITLLGALFGIFPTGYLVDKIGRRIPILISAFPILVGWLLMSLSDSVGLLYFGRFLAGISAGALSVALPLYLTELAESRIRGQIAYSFTQQLFTGALFVTLIGNVFGWNYMVLGLKCIPVAIVLFVATYFLPESPIYLFGIGENGRGSDAIKWFRTTTDPATVEMEIKEIESSQGEKYNLDIQDQDDSQSSMIKQVGIPAFLMLLQQLSCGAHFIFGIISISDTITGKTMETTAVSLTIQITSIVTIIIAANFVDKLGRRPLLITSCVLMSLSIFVLGICIYIQAEESSDPVLNKLKWIRLVSFAIYISAFSFGLGPISWLLMAELVPGGRHKGFWSAVVTSFYWFPGFILGMYFPLFELTLTLPGFLWFCTFICLVSALFSYLFVPETAKRSIPEIQAFFENSLETLKMEYPI